MVAEKTNLNMLHNESSRALRNAPHVKIFSTRGGFLSTSDIFFIMSSGPKSNIYYRWNCENEK